MQEINNEIKLMIDTKRNLVEIKNKIIDYNNRQNVLYCKRLDRLYKKNFLKFKEGFRFGFFFIFNNRYNIANALKNLIKKFLIMMM